MSAFESTGGSLPFRNVEDERRRTLPPAWHQHPRLGLDHWFTTDESYNFYRSYACIECGRPEAEHYRRTMLDDLMALGWRQVQGRFEVMPELPLFLERPVALA